MSLLSSIHLLILLARISKMYEKDGLRGMMNSVSAYFDTKIQH